MAPATRNKIVAITLAFWVMKILATTLGETAGDFLSMTLNLGYYAGLGITMAILAAVIAAHVWVKKLYPELFWLAVIATTTAGTEISDFMDRSLGLGYQTGALVLFGGLLASLGLWYVKDRSLHVFPLKTPSTEAMFWLAVLFSNSLGTAFGDYLVDDAGLSFLQGALVTSGIIGLVAVLHYSKKLNDTLLFWVAFIFTRPFGATFGDFLTKPLASGGLNLPREGASLVAFGLLVAVLYGSHALSRRKKMVWER